MNPLNLFKYLEKEKGKPMPLKIKFVLGLPVSPEELNVKGDLYLYGLPQITSLPQGLKVEESLILTRTPISLLPSNLKVGKNLYLTNCKKITSLPKGLQVGGNLYLVSTNISFLPPDLHVGENIYIDNTPLSKKPDEEINAMLITGYVGGHIIKDAFEKVL
jgi:hypothetical protein